MTGGLRDKLESPRNALARGTLWLHNLEMDTAVRQWRKRKTMNRICQQLATRPTRTPRHQ